MDFLRIVAELATKSHHGWWSALEFYRCRIFLPKARGPGESTVVRPRRAIRGPKVMMPLANGTTAHSQQLRLDLVAQFVRRFRAHRKSARKSCATAPARHHQARIRIR